MYTAADAVAELARHAPGAFRRERTCPPERKEPGTPVKRNVLRTSLQLAVLLLASCGSADQSTDAAGEGETTAPFTFPLTVADASGINVTVARPPERIVCLSPGCVDILTELDILPAAVTFSLVPLAELPQFFGDRAAAIASISLAGNDPNYEEIAQARPDLVIGTPFDEPKRATLRPIAPLFTLGDTGTYRQKEEHMRTIARLLGREARADEAVRHFESRLEAYKAQAPRNRSVVIMGVFPFGNIIYTAASPSCHLLSEVAQCPWPVPAGATGPSAPITAERLLEVDPDVIFIQTFKNRRVQEGSAGNRFQAPDKRRELEANPFWRELKAVQAGRVHEVEAWPWGGYGTRSLGIVLDEALPLLYPQVFPQPLP